MLIAEEVAKHGMSVSGEFGKFLTHLVSSNGITKVIETGTYMGLGTTKSLIAGLQANKKPFHLISIEINPAFHKMAQRNIGKVQGVELWNGRSIAKNHPFISTDFTDLPDHVIIDHKPEHRKELYEREVEFDVPDSLLQKAVDFFDGKPELVVLDSAGHYGWAEFNATLGMINHPFILALDDTNHGKHYKSVQVIKQKPEIFEVIFETNDKFGSLVARVKC